MTNPLDQHRSGFFTPDDLRLLEVVFVSALQRDLLVPQSPQAEILARSLISAFQHGARDEISLLKAVGSWGRHLADD